MCIDASARPDDIRRRAFMGHLTIGAALIEPATEHVLSPEMWRRTRDWLAKHLKSGATTT